MFHRHERCHVARVPRQIRNKFSVTRALYEEHWRISHKASVATQAAPKRPIRERLGPQRISILRPAPSPSNDCSAYEIPLPGKSV